MRDAEFTASRRRFLGQLFGIAASVALAPSALEALEQLAPRRLYVPAPRKLLVLNAWKEVRFSLTDEELAVLLEPDDTARHLAPLWAIAIEHEMMRPAALALDEALRPGTTMPPRVRLHYDALPGMRHHVVAIDQLGADPANPMVVYARDDDPRDVVLPWGSQPPHWQDISRIVPEKRLQERYDRLVRDLQDLRR